MVIDEIQLAPELLRAIKVTVDVAGLRNLASHLGDKFVAGYVLYTGQPTPYNPWPPPSSDQPHHPGPAHQNMRELAAGHHWPGEESRGAPGDSNDRHRGDLARRRDQGGTP